ncbi:MAG: bifunctional adenosylcobinamide kinase/adenosylcobinamide-phosphate guanylyltransferase [Actinobacteria bacterium]|nr:bifunctional adenosylcobinamide kinase/adenosylcobinamide-phosphate guanylyltransferase [Actinomycetota bacterium]
MEVLLLGTGAADGWPSPFCLCLSCADARARGEVRLPTAALLGHHVLLDAGPAVPGAVARAGRSLRDVHHVLVTHAHPDHLDPALLLWLSWNPTPHTVHVWGPPSVRLACTDWVGPHTPVEFHDVGPGDMIALDTPEGTWHARVHAAAHNAALFGGSHDDIAADSVLLDVTDTRGSRLLYLTDTGPLPDSTVAALTRASADLVLIEETFGDHVDHRTGHLDLATLPHALAALRDVGAIADDGDVIAVHLSHHNPPREVLRARLAEIGVRLVDDGTVLGRATRTLILGGARSGKSSEAERRALALGDVTYVATAAPRSGDAEWDERIAHHRARRPIAWATVEGHRALVDVLRQAGPSQAVLVDCLTLWLTGVLDDAADGADWDLVDRGHLMASADDAAKDLVDALTACHATVLLVSNELGMGVVPMSASTRLFVDLLGRLHQQVGAVCDETVLMVGGRPLAIAGGRR